MKRKALDRLLGDWVLLEVVSKDGEPVRLEGVDPTLARARVVDPGHGSRPTRQDHDVLLDLEGVKRLTIEGEEIVGTDDFGVERRSPKLFALARQDAIVALLADEKVGASS